ncbi:MAG: carboxynorspermidine decarboxylase [Bacteroidaceae bacterium]|nr:carboxynorspermidine decarboxylase [Bacteroidaceae bacterium]
MKIKTPYYLVEEGLLRRNLSLIKHVADESGAEVILAFKAFALWRTFPIFREYISHTTASSPYEARLAMEEFGSPAHTYSPAYTEEDFPTILRCSTHVTFNSLSQLERFRPMVEAYNREHPEKLVSCGLRVNPEYSEIETELYNPCAPGSRFGVLAEDLRLKAKDKRQRFIEGFHCHNHCESSAEALQESLRHLEAKFGQWLPQLKWLNLGGGHLMTRKDYNVPLLIQLIKELRAKYPNLKIILEPGSAFAWQTGPLVSSVVDIVENHGIKTAILDVSFTCHMPDCLEMPYQPAVRGAISVEANDLSSLALSPIYRLGGNSCLSGDFMGLWQFDHELQIGEQVIFEDMIHYTTVKTTMFNGIQHPSIVLQHTGGELEILRQYTYEDYRDRMC